MNEYTEHPKLTDLKKSIATWEECCNCKILQRHLCQDEANSEQSAIQDAAVFFASYEDSAPTWMFAHIWFAGDKEVYDGEAVEIGEIMNSYCCRISFCPFCGERLAK